MKEEIEFKVCFKCNYTLPLNEFYKHPQMSDGHLNKCIPCTKKDVKENEEKLRKDPEWIFKEKKRQRDKSVRLNYGVKYKRTPAQKKEIIKRYVQKFPEKKLATQYTGIFLTKVSGMNLHHWSYNQEDWLDVIELTIKEHGFIHRYIVYDQERMMYRDLKGILLDTKEAHLRYYEECKEKYEY